MNFSKPLDKLPPYTLLLSSIFALVAGGVQLSATTWITLIASVVLGALPFVALGFAIGNVINPTGVGPIINLSFFALSFASGIFVPIIFFGLAFLAFRREEQHTFG